MTGYSKSKVLSAVLLLPALLTAQSANIDALVERTRAAFNVPGIAVAVVKDGKVVLEKGYGVRSIETKAPVTAHTLFRIASNTKAFTAAAMAILVDEGKVHWNDHVVDLLPGFQMYDSYVTREMTVADLFVHRSGLGLGEGDLMFFPPSDLTREEILHRLRFLKPATSFRSSYAYDNLLYLVAGSIIPAVTGKSWDDFVRERIFTPLGMSESVLNTAAFLKARDIATPHSELDGKPVVVEQENVDNNAPAGSIASCVHDLAKWMMVQLNRGEMDSGRRLFSEAQSRTMWRGLTIMPIPTYPKEAPKVLDALKPNFSEYALGWHTEDYRGHKLVGHTGGLSGFVSRTFLVPDQKLGIVILTNAEHDGAHTALAWSIADEFLGAPKTDWIGAYRELEKLEGQEIAKVLSASAGKRNANSKPSLPLASYAGTYRDQWYGDIIIREENGKLTIQFSHTKALAGSLEHWQYDTFVARWKERSMNADAYVTFNLKPDGSIDEVRMKAVSPATDFSFDFQDLLLRPVK